MICRQSRGWPEPSGATTNTSAMAPCRSWPGSTSTRATSSPAWRTVTAAWSSSGCWRDSMRTTRPRQSSGWSSTTTRPADVGRVVVEDHPDDCLGRVVRIESRQQPDELQAAVTVLHAGEDVARVEVDPGQDRHGAMADVFVVAPEGSGLARDWRQIRRGQSECLDTRLLVDADGVDRIGPVLVNDSLGVDRDVPIHHQDLVHLAIEVRIATLQVVRDLVGLDVDLVEDAPDGALARVGQTRKARRLGVFGHEPREAGDRPQLRGQPMLSGLGAGDAHDPGPGFVADLRLVRTVVGGPQPGLHARRERLVDARVDRRPTDPDPAREVGDRDALRIAQQHSRALDLAHRRRSRSGESPEHRLLILAQRQSGALRPSRHERLPRGWGRPSWRV